MHFAAPSNAFQSIKSRPLTFVSYFGGARSRGRGAWLGLLLQEGKGPKWGTHERTTLSSGSFNDRQAALF